MGKVKKKFVPAKNKPDSPETSSQSAPSFPKVHIEPLSSQESTEEMDVNANESCETPTTEKANDPNPAGTTESSKVSLSTRFLIINSTDFSSSIKALLAMEEYPSLQVSTKITPQGDYILQAKDNDTLTLAKQKFSTLEKQ